jgi:hypothetical protein
MGVERGRATQAVPTSARNSESPWRPPQALRRADTRRPATSPSSATTTPAATVAPASGPRARHQTERGLFRLRHPTRRRRGVIESAPAPETPRGARIGGARERVLGLAGVLVSLFALVWALLVDGGAAPVGALVVAGLVLATADALVWRKAAYVDLAVDDGERLPSVPWGMLVGPAGLFGAAAALVAAAPPVAVVAAVAVVAVLPGLFARLPATGVSDRVAGHARRVRMFVRSHGTTYGESVPGYASPVGSAGARLFVFAPNGSWGDVMLRPDEVDDVARLARIDVADEHDPSVARRLAIGPSLWTLMNRSW